MAANAPRHLLLGASRPAPPALRLLPRANPSRIFPSRAYKRPYQKVPPAPAPAPPAQSEYAQKAQERALMSKLSTLSPDQIRALLSSQPDTASSPPPPPPPSSSWFGRTNNPEYDSIGNPSTSKLKYFFFGLTAIFLGHLAGEAFIQNDERLAVVETYPLGEDDPNDPELHRCLEGGADRSLSVILNTSLLGTGSGTALLGLPLYGSLMVHPSGLVTYLQRAHLKPANITYEGQKMVIRPDDTVVVDASESSLDDNGKVVSWPAHMRLLDRLDTRSAVARRRKHHLVAGTYGSVQTLGGIYQMIQDPATDALSVIVSFGNRMCGFARSVHNGAIATVLDESMGRLAVRHLPSNTAVTAKLIITHNTNAMPEVEHMYRIQLDVLTKEAAAELEDRIRREEASVLVSNGWMGSPETRQHIPQHVAKVRGEPPAPVELDQVQTERKVWIRAVMRSVTHPITICEAEGLFVVPKGVKLEKLGEHW
ncbi:hypothetical protein F5X68DRAFT_257678 [Plectosphaerella plurivora]|uniref:Uncharacterized protein n=1 Tax=Plectosphaerella plurivora TaxID=936078 RepID=A0A9P9AFX0_9PEZI|nr:hypothetical protein F5X68DRAFT_257678 [Plectosphaerella plurivora]